MGKRKKNVSVYAVKAYSCTLKIKKKIASVKTCVFSYNLIFTQLYVIIFCIFIVLSGIGPGVGNIKKNTHTQCFLNVRPSTHGIPRESRGLLSRRRDVHNLCARFYEYFTSLLIRT